MFTFFIKKKKLVVDCFTAHLNAYNFAPIVKTWKTLPEWWTNLPNPGYGNPRIWPKSNNNMRRCYGFIELYKRGFTIEHWSDMHLEVNKHDILASGSDIRTPVTHSSETFKGAFKNYRHLKLESPWAIKEKTGVHWAWMAAEWELENYDFKIMPGVIEYKINGSTNIQMLIPVKNDPYNIYIPIGQPLVQVVPLNDDIDFEYKTHLVDESEMERIRSIMPSFKGFYALKKLMKRNEARQASDKKCPFHF